MVYVAGLERDLDTGLKGAVVGTVMERIYGVVELGY